MGLCESCESTAIVSPNEERKETRIKKVKTVAIIEEAKVVYQWQPKLIFTNKIISMAPEVVKNIHSGLNQYSYDPLPPADSI